GQVAGHRVDAVSEILPGSGDAGDDGLAAELAVGADLAGDAGDFGGEAAELIDHGVDRFFELQNLAAHVDGDFFRQFAVGHGDGDIGDAAHLGGQVPGHEIDAVGQILPHAAHVANLRLAAELAFGADFARDAGHFAGEGVELLHHGVDHARGGEKFAAQRLAFRLHGDGLGEVAFGDGADDARHFRGWTDQIFNQLVDRVDPAFPRAARRARRHPLGELPFAADHAAHALDLSGAVRHHFDDVVQGVGDLAVDAAQSGGQAHRKVALFDRGQSLQKLPRIEPVHFQLACGSIRHSSLLRALTSYQ